MFPRGARFLPPKIPDVPGPNTYNINQESQLDSYKRGAFLEKADRFSQDKPSDVAGPGTHDNAQNSEMKHSIKGHGKPSAHPSAYSDQCSIWKKRTEELEQLVADSKRIHQVEFDRQQFELARYHKANAELSERLEKYKKQAESLDVRRQELKKSSSADQVEVRELRQKLRVSEHERAQLAGKQGETSGLKKALQALESKRRDESREKDKKIAELERSLGIETKRREATESQLRDIERRKGAGSTVQRLETQVNDAQDKARQAQAALQTLISETTTREQELVSQLEEHRLILARVAEEYGRLASATVPNSTHSALNHRYSSLQLKQFRLERKLANVEGQVVELTNLVRYAMEENSFLSTRLGEVEDEARFYSDALTDSARDWEICKDLDQEQTTQDTLSAIVTDIHECREQNLEMRAQESEVVGRFYHLVNEELSQLFWSADKALEDNEVLINQHTTNLEVASAAQQSLITQLEAALAERVKTQTQLNDVVASNEELKTTSATLELQLKEAEAKQLQESSEHDKLLRKERHLVQSLTSTVQKSRMAEESLRAEIDQLTAELHDAERYQEAYYSLSDEVNALVARNELAECEAQRLSKFNAEILGHTNPAQRIMYVDRIRRELANTKHQLLKSTLDHETAVADVNALRHELDLYKSVTVENKPRTHITRIGRKVLADQSINISAILNEHSSDEKIQHVQMLDIIPDDMTLDELSCIS